MKHSELRHQPRHVNPRIQVLKEYIVEKSSHQQSVLLEVVGFFT